MAIQERNVHTAQSKGEMSVHRSMEATTLPPIKTATRAGPDNLSSQDDEYMAQHHRISVDQSPSRNMKMRTKKKS